jgi:hypothetical protein
MFGLRPAQRVKADRFAPRVLKKRRLYCSRRAKLTPLAFMIGRFGSVRVNSLAIRIASVAPRSNNDRRNLGPIVDV